MRIPVSLVTLYGIDRLYCLQTKKPSCSQCLFYIYYATVHIASFKMTTIQNNTLSFLKLCIAKAHGIAKWLSQPKKIVVQLMSQSRGQASRSCLGHSYVLVFCGLRLISDQKPLSSSWTLRYCLCRARFNSVRMLPSGLVFFQHSKPLIINGIKTGQQIETNNIAWMWPCCQASIIFLMMCITAV